MITDLRTWQYGSLVLWDNDADLPPGTTFVEVTGGTGWTPGRYPLDASGVALLNLGAPDGFRVVASVTKPPAGLGDTGGIGTAIVGGIRLVFDGNSMTAGYGLSSPADAYPEQCVVLLGQRYAETNFGVSGQTTPGMQGDEESQILPLYVGGTQDILVAWEVGNDLDSNAATPADAVQNFRDYCAVATAAGFRVVILTVTPRNGTNVGSPEDWNARRIEANELLLADFPISAGASRVRLPDPGTYAAVLVVVASHPLLADCTDGTYYQADTIHLTAAGYAVVAADVANGVRELLGAVSSGGVGAALLMAC